jgi:hypothetical protein
MIVTKHYLFMTKQNLLSTAITILLGVGGLSLAVAVEPADLTTKDLKTAIATAKTPKEHQRIANYYKKEADRMLADAVEHEELATVYAKSGDPQGTKHPMAGQTVDHCKYFSEAARKAAQESRELAKLHEEMAKQAK